MRWRFGNCSLVVLLAVCGRITVLNFTPNWAEEVFTISSVKATKPPMYTIKDTLGETVQRTFYEQELQLSAQEIVRIERVLKKKKNKVFVKWKGYSDMFNLWVLLSRNINKQYAWQSAEDCGENYPLLPRKLRRLVIGKSGCGKTTIGMKLADIDDVTIKSNYCPISGLPAGSKIFERIIQRQIAIYMETLSPYLCGYRKGYSVQHALIALLEKIRLSLDNKGYGGALLMD